MDRLRLNGDALGCYRRQSGMRCIASRHCLIEPHRFSSSRARSSVIERMHSAACTCRIDPSSDGIHLEARLEEQAQCILVIIGATPEGRKELVGFTDGMRESSQSWRDLLLDVKRRSLRTAPQIAVTDGALGFWKAL